MIDRIAAFCITGRVGIPVHEKAAALVEPRSFFAETVKVFVETKLLRRGNEHSRRRIKLHLCQRSFAVVGHRLLVGINCFARTSIAEID